MTMLTLAILAATLATGALLWLPRLRRATTWRAMVTPLASIIGSGFLVLGPVLDHAYGGWAPVAMALLCLAAYGFGWAVRVNIAHLDAHEGNDAAPRWVETLASALLGFAYTISVAYYLNLFGSFAFSLTPLENPAYPRMLTTAVYVAIIAIGATRGFAMLERAEYASVSLKLAIIAGLLAGLGAHFAGEARSGTLAFEAASLSGWAAITLGFGLVVTVQGFETSRYLGKEYDAPTRIRSMRLAQWISTAIYMVYVALFAASLSPGGVPLSETAVVDMMAVVAPILPAMLVAAALAAQFSAAVADTGGSGGLIEELTGGRLDQRRAYLLVGGAGIALTWSADVFQIISYASRAFAAYYAVQAALAARRAAADGGRAGPVFFAALACLGGLITLFGQPVE